MKYKILGILMLISFIPFISSAPTIIKNNVSLDIVNGLITLKQDGSVLISESISCTNVTQTANSTILAINPCNYFNFNKEIESLSIKEIGNGTDIAILIEQLRKYNEDCTMNKTIMFENCKDENRNLTTQVELLSAEKGYKAQFDACNIEKNTYKDKAGQNTLFGLGGALLGAFAIYMFLKSGNRVINQPREQREGYSGAERH